MDETDKPSEQIEKLKDIDMTLTLLLIVNLLMLINGCMS